MNLTYVIIAFVGGWLCGSLSMRARALHVYAHMLETGRLAVPQRQEKDDGQDGKDDQGTA